MKMTMHIEENVLERVMEITGAPTKTAAVKIALHEMANQHLLIFREDLQHQKIGELVPTISLSRDLRQQLPGI